MQKPSFTFPTKAGHLLKSTQTISRVVHAIISYNVGSENEHFYQLFIDEETLEWVAREILDPFVFKAFCHPLLLQQVLINLTDEIAECHQRFKLTNKSKKPRLSESGRSKIASSVQKLYMESLKDI